MVPDFPNLKKDIFNRILLPAFNEARQTDPLLGNLKYTNHYEGNEIAYLTEEGKEEQQEYVSMGSEWQILPSDVITKPFDFFIEKFRQMGIEASSQMAQHSFRVINEAVESVGNVVQANNEPMSLDLFLQMINKILIDFDDDTESPEMPIIYVHPSQTLQVKKLMEDAKNSPEFDKKFKSLMETKKKEWRDREANRKLVD